MVIAASLITFGILLLDADGNPDGFTIPQGSVINHAQLSSAETLAYKQELEAFNEDLKQISVEPITNEESYLAAFDQIRPLLDDRTAEFESALIKLVKNTL